MPKNKVNDLITDQEMAFARLVLSGTVTDRDAAETVGLHPDSAAYTKSKPRVRAYMLEYREAVQQQHAEQEAEERRRTTLEREQVLARLWEIANLSPEITRGSVTSQVKALAMIVAMQNLIPDRRAGAPEKKPAPIYAQAYVTAGPPPPAVAPIADPQETPVRAQQEAPETPSDLVTNQASLLEDSPYVSGTHPLQTQGFLSQ